MAFGWAGAAAGAAGSLDEILTKKLIEAQQQQQMQLQQQRLAQDATQFDASQALQQGHLARLTANDATAAADLAGQRERQGRLDDVADTDRREVKNQQGVRKLALEGLRLRTAQPRDVQLMAAGEGVDIDSDVLDPDKAHRERLAQIEAQGTSQIALERERGAQDRATNQGRAAVAGSGAGGPAPDGPSPYMAERNVRNKQSVDELLGRVTGWTAGAGSILSRIPATDARDFQADLNTLKANIAFGELTAMREASKTGGALGQVAVRELELLEATLGSLDQGQSPESLRKNLQQVRDSIDRWERASAGGSGGGGRASGAGPTGGGFRVVGKRPL